MTTAAALAILFTILGFVPVALFIRYVAWPLAIKPWWKNRD